MREASRTPITYCKTRKTTGAAPYRQAHLLFMAYVCVVAALVTYETVNNIVHGKNQCLRPRTLKPHKKIKMQAGQATPTSTFALKATTFDCGLYISNLRCNVRCNHGGQGNAFF